MSYIARMVYSYKDRYVLTATFRADGSSKFSKENRFSYFPSFSAAWRMSEEKFAEEPEFHLQPSSCAPAGAWSAIRA